MDQTVHRPSKQPAAASARENAPVESFLKALWMR
jgi:hypothetical protein